MRDVSSRTAVEITKEQKIHKTTKKQHLNLQLFRYRNLIDS